MATTKNKMAAKPVTNKDAMRKRSRHYAPKYGSQQKLEQLHNTMQQLGTTPTNTNATPSQKLKSGRKTRLYSTPEFEHLALEAAKLDPLSPIFFNLYNTTIQNDDDMDATLAIGVYTNCISTPPTNSSKQTPNDIGLTIPTLADVVENTLNQTSGSNPKVRTFKINIFNDRNPKLADVKENTQT
ncbi:hypothetical protein ACJMK2_013334 [Sinanodonta woodiana]|uniref:Uncharacterized protein n=1 Tax=Sinanodonta woodiana TaxID=1069815 RepID=A0ABD3UXW1_SINWO